VGKQTRESLEQSVAQANKRMARAMVSQPAMPRAQLSVAEYRRHVFSSDVVYSLQVRDEAGQTQEFLFSDHLQHGPFPLAALSSGHLRPMLALSQARLLPSAVTQAWFDSLNGETPLTGVTRVRFGGAATSDWAFQPLNLVREDEVLKFSGGTVQAIFENQFADSRIVGGFDLFDYSRGPENERLVLDDIGFQYSSTSESNATRMNATTQAASVRLDVAGQDALSLQDVAMQASSEQVGDLAGGSIRYDVGQVRLGDHNLGSLSLGARGRDVSMPALSSLALFYDDLSARHGTDNSSWQLSSEEAAQLQNKLLALLAADPVFSLDPLVWKNEQGQSHIKLTARLTRPPAADGAVALDALLQQLVHALDLELKVEKPMFVHALVQLQTDLDDASAAALAATLYDQYASRLQAAGMALITDAAATVNIGYRDGRIDANGKTMTVPEFFQRALLVLLM